MGRIDDVFVSEDGFIHVDKTIDLSLDEIISFGIIADDHDELSAGAPMNPITALALADAIYDDLGLGWKPYPENKPECTDTTRYLTKTKYHGYETMEYNPKLDIWYGSAVNNVLAFFSIPPYRPEAKERMRK